MRILLVAFCECSEVHMINLVQFIHICMYIHANFVKCNHMHNRVYISSKLCAWCTCYNCVPSSGLEITFSNQTLSSQYIVSCARLLKKESGETVQKHWRHWNIGGTNQIEKQRARLTSDHCGASKTYLTNHTVVC